MYLLFLANIIWGFTTYQAPCQELPYLILTTTQWGRCYYHLHFTNEKIYSKSWVTFTITQPVSGGTWDQYLKPNSQTPGSKLFTTRPHNCRKCLNIEVLFFFFCFIILNIQKFNKTIMYLKKIKLDIFSCTKNEWNLINVKDGKNRVKM